MILFSLSTDRESIITAEDIRMVAPLDTIEQDSEVTLVFRSLENKTKKEMLLTSHAQLTQKSINRR